MGIPENMGSKPCISGRRHALERGDPKNFGKRIMCGPGETDSLVRVTKHSEHSKIVPGTYEVGLGLEDAGVCISKGGDSGRKKENMTGSSMETQGGGARRGL